MKVENFINVIMSIANDLENDGILRCAQNDKFS